MGHAEEDINGRRVKAFAQAIDWVADGGTDADETAETGGDTTFDEGDTTPDVESDADRPEGG